MKPGKAACVPSRMINDILSFGIPTMLTGDIYQLDPPMSKPTEYMLEENCNISLTKVFRYDDKSGILGLALKAKDQSPIQYGIYGDSKVVHFRDIQNELYKYDALICYKNKTRVMLNKMVRDQLNYEKVSCYPLKGEKIICLKNNYGFHINYNDIEVYIVNGLIGIVLENSYIDDDGFLNIKFIPDFMYEGFDYNYPEIFDIKCHKEYFEYTYNQEIDLPPMFGSPIEANENNNINKEIEAEEVVFATYGYALSAYKAQGSQFENIVVISDDIPMGTKIYPKYLYSAITRAQKSVTIASFK